MKKTLITLLFLLAMVTFTSCSRADDMDIGNEVVPGIPVKNTVTLVDLGATT